MAAQVEIRPRVDTLDLFETEREVVLDVGGGIGVMRQLVVFFKQKTAYEILTCDWSSDVCSSDLCSKTTAPEYRMTGRLRMEYITTITSENIVLVPLP